MRFSIITVTYQNLSGLIATRASLAAQAFSDFEWIVVDGGSVDGTRDALAQWQADIAAVVSEKDKGPYDAMNKGAALARGKYLLFINAGDALAAADVLAKLDKAIGDKQPDFVYGDSLEEQINGTAHYKKSRAPIFRWWGMFTHHQSMVYRRDFLRAFYPLYDLRFRVGADLDLTWRIFKHTRKTQRVHFAISRCAPAGISATHAKEGRLEQLTMRQEHARCPALVNALIMLGQKTVWELRQNAPWLYRFFRLRRNSAVSS